MTLTGLSLRRRASFALAMTFGTVILADWLLYNQPVGINLAIFGAALLLAVLMRGGVALRTWLGRGFALACVGMVAALTLEPGPLPVVMGMACLFALAVADRGGWSNAAALYVLGIGRFVGRMCIQPLLDARIGHRWQRSRGMRNPFLVVLVRWVIPVLLSLIFVGLFALANPIIEKWMADVPDLLAPLRFVFWTLIGLTVWGLLRAKLSRHASESRAAVEPVDGEPPTRGIGAIERETGSTWITRSLILFNAVFAVQTVLDLIYLYGGSSLPEGTTYAQYAHRGAYPLIATALLAGLFVLITFRPGGLAERSVWARRLVFLWIAQNVLLVFSSVWRLSLYVDVYSLTRWRIAAGIWMLLVAIGLITLVARIVRRYDNRWLIQANTLTAGVVLYACCCTY